MSQTLADHDVFTLAEVANYLRLSPEQVLRQVGTSGLPGRQVDEEWRFLKVTVDEWLNGPDHRHVLLAQAGVLADDESLPELRDAIYRERGRSEEEEDSRR